MYAGDYQVYELRNGIMKKAGTFSTQKSAIHDARLRLKLKMSNHVEVIDVRHGKTIYGKVGRF